MVSGFDGALIGMIGGHPSITVGTCDRALCPTVARGFGARVIGGGEAVEVVVSRWPGPQTRANLEATGRLAVTFTAPETFESYQVKGRAKAWGACTDADLALVEAYTAVIRRRIAALDEPAEVVMRTFAARAPFRVRFSPEVVFLQTPGRHAGQRL